MVHVKVTAVHLNFYSGLLNMLLQMDLAIGDDDHYHYY